MKLGQQLKIKQNQSLIMTPQLQQAIKLLQLTNIELSDFIDKAQLENPFLKENSQTITKKSEEEKSSNTYENMNSSLDPLKNDSKLDLENTFDSHISSNSKIENKKLFDKEVIRSGSNKSAGEVIEKIYIPIYVTDTLETLRYRMFHMEKEVLLRAIKKIM